MSLSLLESIVEYDAFAFRVLLIERDLIESLAWLCMLLSTSSVLKSHNFYLMTFENALSLLRRLIYHSITHAKEATAVGVFQPLYTLLLHSTTPKSLINSILKTMAQLVLGVESPKVWKELVSAILPLADPEAPAIADAVGELLYHVTTMNSVAQDSLEVPNLIKWLLEAWPFCQDPLLHLLPILQNLANNSFPNSREMLAHGISERLLPLILSDGPQQIEAVSLANVLFAVDSEATLTMLEAGLFPPILDIIQHHNDSEILLEALWCLTQAIYTAALEDLPRILTLPYALNAFAHTLFDSDDDLYEAARANVQKVVKFGSQIETPYFNSSEDITTLNPFNLFLASSIGNFVAGLRKMDDTDQRVTELESIMDEISFS